MKETKNYQCSTGKGYLRCEKYGDQQVDYLLSGGLKKLSAGSIKNLRGENVSMALHGVDDKSFLVTRLGVVCIPEILVKSTRGSSSEALE